MKKKRRFKKWTYLIPVYGFILMVIEPYVTNDAVFVFKWFFIHAFITAPLPALTFMYFM